MARQTSGSTPRTTASTVRAELARRRISGRELASLLNISERTVRRRLTGDTAFTAAELAVLAAHFGVAIESLLADEPEPVPA